jgi:formylglycine-generating enzyme
MIKKAKRWFLVLPVLGLFGTVFGQDISNVQVQRNVVERKVVITYDLGDLTGGKNNIDLQMSNDGGKTWGLEPAIGSLSGDVGVGIEPGKGKKITWEAGDVFPNLSEDGFLARLSIEKTVSSASSGVAASAPEPTANPTAVAAENEAESESSKSLPPTVTGRDGAVRVLIPAGYFLMGSPADKGQKDEFPQHKVWVSAFYMDQKLVTFDQYDKYCEIMGIAKPVDGYIQYKVQPHWGRGKHPVLNLTWKEARDYCRWAGGRLPTEAEWEKAARGGTDTPYFWGKDDSKAADYAWYDGDSQHRTFPVGELKPNPYGLYDIVGNLWEWVSDWYSEDYYSESPERNPGGPEIGKLKVLRGGSFANGTDCLQVTHRAEWDPEKEDGKVDFIGHVFEHGCRCVSTP